MNQHAVKNIFSFLYNKKYFRFVITGFSVVALISWIYLSNAINSNIDYRLDKELDRVTSIVTENLNNYAGILGYVNAYFRTEGTPNEYRFRRLSESIEIQRINYGLQGIGYIQIVKKNELSQYIKKNKNRPFFNIKDLKPGNELYAPVTMVEPMNWRLSEMLGHDLMSIPERSEMVRDAIASASITMSPLMVTMIKNELDPQISILLLSPLYSQLDTPADPETRLKYVKGLIYVPIRLVDFFERSLGKSNRDEERVNFKIEIINPNTQVLETAYQRFDVPSAKSDKYRSRIIDLYGKKWKVSISPFPHFYNFGDRYLANAVAISLIILIVLLMSIFRQSQVLLEHEKKSKEIMQEAIQKSRAHTVQLKRLNEINKHTAIELDLKNLIVDFFQAGLQISQSTHAFLYCNSTPDNPTLINLHDSFGFSRNEIIQKSLTMEKLNSLFEKNLLTQDNIDSPRFFSKFLYGTDQFVDWILVTIPSREFKQCGLMFLARKRGEKYSENDLEIIESMVSQVAIGIDNSYLFKKVEDSSRVKTAFLSNMSHEIRTPLNAITGYSEILGKTVDPKEKYTLMENIKKNSLQLTSIIDNILDISKVEFGRIYINKEKISLYSVVEDLSWVMEMRAKSKGIHFQIEGVGPLPAYFETDESRVKQILINLIGNAIKFTDTGSVKLQIQCEISSPITNECQLIFNVIDTGIGISKQAQLVLFQSFSQADMSSTRRFGGVGLGLALSKRLAQQFGGDVRLVDSALSNGSIFQLKIPCGKSFELEWQEGLFESIQSLAPHSSRHLPADLKNKKILVVEDSEDNQEIFKYFLKSAGAFPEVIDNGEDAVNKVIHANYDFILMDIQLPRMDGLEATRRIRAKGYLKPIIALTAHSSIEEKINCLKAGCVDLITKPVTQETLINQILFIMEENKHVGEN